MADIIKSMLMLDMDKAVERITNAIQNNEKSRFTVTMTLTELPQPHFYTNFYFHSVQMSNTTYLTAKVRDTV